MKKQVVIAIVTIIIIAGIFASKSLTGKTIAQSDSKEFTVKAFRFGYTPDTITVNKGDKIIIKINNLDVTHGMRIPDLNLKDNEQIEFTAEKTGEFDWYCANYCGDEHTEMKGKLIVE